MGNTNSELKNILEAALLVAGQPLTVEKMMAMFPQETCPTREEIRDALKAIEADYAGRGITIRQIDRGWRIQTREKYTPWVAKLIEERPPRYTRALLETLAIIVYRQPITRGDIEEIRGVSVSTEIIRTLLGREWIKQVGVRDVPGRPALFGTTRQFLEHFNLKNLDELPPLAELRELGVIGAELDLRLADSALELPSTSKVAPSSSDEDSQLDLRREATPDEENADTATRAQSAAGD